MKWIPKSVLILGLMLFQIPASYAQANLYTDPFGNTPRARSAMTVSTPTETASVILRELSAIIA